MTGKVFKAKRTASAKALRQETTWCLLRKRIKVEDSVADRTEQR